MSVIGEDWHLNWRSDFLNVYRIICLDFSRIGLVCCVSKTGLSRELCKHFFSKFFKLGGLAEEGNRSRNILHFNLTSF